MIIPTKRNLKSNKKSNKNFPQKKKKNIEIFCSNFVYNDNVKWTHKSLNQQRHEWNAQTKYWQQPAQTSITKNMPIQFPAFRCL